MRANSYIVLLDIYHKVDKSKLHNWIWIKLLSPILPEHIHAQVTDA